MRVTFSLASSVLIVLSTLASAQEKTPRHGIAADAKTYPQATAKEALASVLKAAADKKIDYLVAHLADPTFVDDRVKRIYGGQFSEQVADTRARLDPFTVKRLKRFLDEGKWEINKSAATVTLDEKEEKQVKLVQREGKWYLGNEWGK